MNYKIEEVEGIGPSYGAKLRAAGIASTGQLLARCAARKGRQDTAEKSGISEKLILEWTNLTDLMRINGIGKQFSELLEASGVDTVKELKMRRADNLAAKMAEVNAAKKLTRAVPNETKVAGWIEQAKTLAPVIEY